MILENIPCFSQKIMYNIKNWSYLVYNMSKTKIKQEFILDED